MTADLKCSLDEQLDERKCPLQNHQAAACRAIKVETEFIAVNASLSATGSTEHAWIIPLYLIHRCMQHAS